MRGDVVRFEAGHARGGELDREREAIDPTTDLHEGAPGVLGVVRCERGESLRASPLAKQLHRRFGGEWRDAGFQPHGSISRANFAGSWGHP